MRPIMCSTMLQGAAPSAWVERGREVRREDRLLQLAQNHDDDGLIRFLGFRDLVA